MTMHHIGSTAVPDLAAKPTIDMILEVKNITKVDQCNVAMEAIGYEAWGEYNIPGRRFFLKGKKKRTHHIHTFQQGSKEIARPLYLRDYLIAHPLIALEYASLKIQLAEKFANNRRQYFLGKEAFVKKLEQDVIQCFQQQKLKG